MERQDGISASLVPPSRGVLETSPQDTPDFTQGTTAYQRHVLGPLLGEYTRIVSTLDAAAADGHLLADVEKRVRSQVKRIADCCRFSQVMTAEDDGSVAICRQRCKSRLCPYCGRRRSMQLRGTMIEAVRKLDSPRFVTLTLRSSAAPLRDQVQQVNRAFATLRRTDLWKRNFTGGVYVVEVTFNRHTLQWHPHIHVIVDGQFVPQKDLKSAWERVTGGSTIVDIRKCHSIKSAVDHLCTYTTKSQDASHVPSEFLAEWADAMHGLRMASTFGTLHGCRLNPDKEPMTEGMKSVCPMGVLATQADRGDARAQDLFNRLIATDARQGRALTPEAQVKLTASTRQLVAELRSWWDDYQNPPEARAAAIAAAAASRRRRVQSDSYLLDVSEMAIVQ